MAWITPSVGGPAYDGTLPDFDPIEVVLKSVSVGPDEKFGSGPRATMVWETVKFEGTQIMDWASVKLGKTQAGQVAKMRQIINAVEGRPSDAEIIGIDDETLEYSLAPGVLSGQIKPGVRIIVRGQNVQKEVDGEARTYFRISHHLPVVKSPSTNGKPSGKPLAPTAVPVSSDF